MAKKTQAQLDAWDRLVDSTFKLDIENPYATDILEPEPEVSYAKVLKFNPFHDKLGQFSSSTDKILNKVHTVLVNNGFVHALKEIGHNIVHQYDHPKGPSVKVRGRSSSSQNNYPYGGGNWSSSRRDPWD